MKLLLSSLLLASHCAISSWSVSSTDTLVLTQTPDVSVREGDTFNITCCFPGTYPRIRLSWWKNQTEMKGEVVNQTQESYFCLNLTFFKITTKHSGRYICKVFIEIPTHSVVSGNGTVISVMNKDDGEDNTDHAGEHTDQTRTKTSPIIIASAVAVPLLLITLLCFCCLWRRRAQAARVIYEVPHVDSEVAEMDKHSTSSSRGSSHWCQVPVYESFDYFERVQTKESG